jgi:hypothetical protein
MASRRITKTFGVAILVKDLRGNKVAKKSTK